MRAALLLTLALAGQTALAPRLPADQARLMALAEALGQAHGLHRLCAGPTDDLWRSRMGRLIEVERPDPGLKQRLTDAFNTGYANGSAAFQACSTQSKSALSEVERRAAAQSRTLAGTDAAKAP